MPIQDILPTEDVRNDELSKVLAPSPQEPALIPESEPELPTRSGRKVLFAIAAAGLIAFAATLIWRYAFQVEKLGFLFARAERGPIEATVSATGTCNAVVTVQVGSQVSGNIKALYADFNTRVKAGQLVAEIDPEIFEAQVKQAEAALRNSAAAFENAKASAEKADADLYSAKAAEVNQLAAIAKAKVAVADAKTKLARRVQLFNEKILDQEDLDTAQATQDEAIADQNAAEAQHDAALHNITSAEAALNAAKKQVIMFQAEIDLNQAALNQSNINLRHTRITAPVDGTVVSRNMDVGQTVAASFQAPTIFLIAQDLTKMQVDTNVAESDVGRLKLGQTATFVVDAYPGVTFPGRVIQIREAPINVQNVITYDAVIEAHNPDLKLFPGMTANVTISTQRSEHALKVPNAALRFKPPESLLEQAGRPARAGAGNWAVVYLAGQKSKVRPVPVKIGITDGNYTEVEAGDLQECQQVIVGIASPGSSPSQTGATPPIPRGF